jgi:glycosyltransferase involved in cell wall biosynthesis
MHKILILGPQPPPLGGVVSVINEITQSRLSSQFKFEVFPTSGGGQPRHCKVFTSIFSRIRKFSRFFFKVATGRYCLIHLHTSARLRGTMLYIFLARVAGTKIILQIHHGNWDHILLRGSRYTKLLISLCLNSLSRILVMNDTWLKDFANLGIRTDIRLVKNFLAPYNPPSAIQIENIGSGLGLNNQSFVVLTVGAITREKGVYDILDAIPSIVGDHDNIRFVFVGGGLEPGDKKRFESEVRERGLSKLVFVMGEVTREDVSAFLSLADVFLLPSHTEAMPISILEAMRSGLAIIATPVGSIPKMIVHGSTGLIVPVGSPTHISQAVLKLKSETNERIRLGESAKQTFDQHFQSDSALGDLELIYQELCM